MSSRKIPSMFSCLKILNLLGRQRGRGGANIGRGGAGGGRGRGRGGGRGRGNAQWKKKTEKSADELDKELDSYHAEAMQT